jgi:hypothetical protein
MEKNARDQLFFGTFASRWRATTSPNERHEDTVGVECGQGRERNSLMRFAALGNPAGEIAPVESVELGAEARGGVSGERRGGEPPAT